MKKVPVTLLAVNRALNVILGGAKQDVKQSNTACIFCVLFCVDVFMYFFSVLLCVLV